MTCIYVDTSALAKWYLNEARSDDVEAYIQAHAPVNISGLTVVEMRSLLARRRRERSFSAVVEMRVFAAFQDDIRRGHLIRYSMEDGHADGAANLLTELARHPLRTLDALHLAIARDLGADVLATADRVMADAAAAMDFEVVRFD